MLVPKDDDNDFLRMYEAGAYSDATILSKAAKILRGHMLDHKTTNQTKPTIWSLQTKFFRLCCNLLL